MHSCQRLLDVEGVFVIYRSCDSCICLLASCSSYCASVSIFSFLEGDNSFLDGVLACAVVAHGLVGVFIIFCGCNSCIVLGLLSSICSAFVGNVFVFEGAFELASISSCLISGGLWFSGHAGQRQKAKDNDSKDYSAVLLFRRQFPSLLILTIRLSRVQVSTASSVACLRVWGRLPDGWTSLTMPRSKRQQHLQVLFVPGQEVWMRSGRSSSGRAKFKFSEGLWWAYQRDYVMVMT